MSDTNPLSILIAIILTPVGGLLGGLLFWFVIRPVLERPRPIRRQSRKIHKPDESFARAVAAKEAP